MLQVGRSQPGERAIAMQHKSPVAQNPAGLLTEALFHSTSESRGAEETSS
jgi:hypothetical protein